MQRISLSLLLITTFGFTSSCQKEVSQLTLDKTVTGLEKNVGKPYRFDFRSTFLTPTPEEGINLSVVKTGTHLANHNWEDCSFVEVTISSDPFRTFFQKTDLGMAHVLYEPDLGEKPEWSCQAMAKPHPKPMGPVNIYPRGSWDYCSQALAMIEALGEESVSFSDQVAIFRWESVSKEIGSEILDHYAGAGWGENTEVSSITLQVNGAIGVPVLLRLELANGESLETTFEDYEHVDDGYLAAVEELRKRLNVSMEVKCWCEGSIYEVSLPLEGGKKL